MRNRKFELQWTVKINVHAVPRRSSTPSPSPREFEREGYDLYSTVFMPIHDYRAFRGNSKYHYYGIRIKPDSPLNTFPQEETPPAMRQPPQTNQR
jgi:hypothetical protein